MPIPGGLTPETIRNAWNQVVHNHPNAAMGTGFPAVLFSSPARDVQAEHIPVINGFVTDKPGNGVVADRQRHAELHQGRLGTRRLRPRHRRHDRELALHRRHDVPGERVRAERLRQGVRRGSARRARSTNIDEPATITQSQLIAGIVAKINSDPGINFVVASQPTDAAGLPQALKMAGHSSVKILVNTPDPTSASATCKAGEIAGIMDVPNTDNMALRWSTPWHATRRAQSVAPSEVAGGDWAVTEGDGPRTSPYPYFLVQDYLAQYEKLWK